VKKEQNGRKSLRRLKPTMGRNASKRKKKFFDLFESYVNNLYSKINT
jgi:hypothetical protein